MFEVLVGVLLGILCVANLALWFKLSNCYDALTSVIKTTKDEIPNLDAIRDEINETLQDFVQNLHVPNAADHLLGAGAQLLQMWGLKKFGNPQLMQQDLAKMNETEFHEV